MFSNKIKLYDTITITVYENDLPQERYSPAFHKMSELNHLLKCLLYTFQSLPALRDHQNLIVRCLISNPYGFEIKKKK